MQKKLIWITRPLHKDNFPLPYPTIEYPLLEYQALQGMVEKKRDYQAIIITSKFSLLHLDPVEFKDITLWAPGPTTAILADQQGFLVHPASFSLDGGALELFQEFKKHHSPQNGPILYVAGEFNSDINDLVNYTVDSVVVYTMNKITEIKPEVLSLLKDGKYIYTYLFSSRTAEVASYLINKYDLNNCIGLALSDKIASKAIQESSRWSKILIAESPKEESLLNLIDLFKNSLMIDKC